MVAIVKFADLLVVSASKFLESAFWTRTVLVNGGPM